MDESKKPDENRNFVTKDLIDHFFNFTLDKASIPKYVKPTLNVECLDKQKEKAPPRELKYKKADYAKQYQHDLIKGQAASVNYCSTMVSGPSHYTQTTFQESSGLDEYETVFFGKGRKIASRKALPIYKHRREIMQSIEQNTVTLIQGATGCGKSTQVPQYIFDTYSKRNKACNIIISQPRRIAAITVANRVATERELEVGNEVGYQVGLKKCTGTELERTQITYCTTGVILQKFIAAKSMNAYTHVILDEVHERSVETDLLIAIIRRFLHINSPNTKLILMSATMEADNFVDFFKIPHEGDFLYPPLIDLTNEERNYKIKEYFIDEIRGCGVPSTVCEKIRKAMCEELPVITQDMCSATAALLSCLLYKYRSSQQHYQATVLIFLPGINEIEMMKDVLETFPCDESEYVDQEIFILHSMIPTEEQKKAFEVTDKAKVILTTNIAESSVTIPAVTHVINFCLSKRLAADKNRLQTLICDWTTKNNCKQRAGRTGRVCDGQVFHMVRRRFYEQKIKSQPTPEICELPLESVILKIKKLEMGSPCEILGVSIDPPDYDAIVDAVLKLKEMGALLRVDINNKFEFDDGEITFIGEVMASLPCDPRISKLIIMGYAFCVLDETIIIAAGLSNPGLFRFSMLNKLSDYKDKITTSDGSRSDLIATLNAYTKWSTLKNEKYFNTESETLWCYNNKLDIKILNEMRIWIEEVKKRLQFYKIQNLPTGHQPIWSRKERIFALKVAIAGAFGVGNFNVPAISVVCERDAFNMVENLDPRNTVYFRNMPQNQVGRVYEPQIINALIQEGVCSDKSKVLVSFDLKQSERVYVSFLNDDDDDKIPQEVYNAIKLRRLKNGISIRTMEPLETLKFAIENKFGISDRGKYVEYKAFIKRPEFCPLPTCFETELKGYVTHVIHCGKFYFRPHVSNGPDFPQLDMRHNKVYQRIKQIIGNTDLQKLKCTSDVMVDDVVITCFEDSMVRAKVIEIIDDKKIKINLMDIGMNLDAEASTIYRVANAVDYKELQDYSPRVILCRLQEIKPSYVEGFDDKWSEKAIEKFEKAVYGKKANLKIYSVVNDVVTARLSVPDENGEVICLNDILVADGYAVECEESYGNKVDYDDRKRRRNFLFSESQKIGDPRDEFKDKVDSSKAKPKSTVNMGHCVNSVRLKGPVSPLEVPLKNVSKQINGYVTIDGSSVNQVLMKESSDCQTLCVAAEMYLESETEKVKLRETTMYPNITGLPVLLALMFAPTVEIQRDEFKSRYASILVGLGADDDHVSYYANRDSLLNIDFDLKESDIHAVNRMRLLLSKLFCVEPHMNMVVPDITDGQRRKFLNKIKDLLIKIISENREPREIEECGTSFDWHVNNEDVEKIPKLHNHIFDLIEVPPLNEMPADKKKKLFDHAIDLESGGHKYQRLYNQECKLCNFFWDNREELKIHLLSQLHKKRKEQLIKSLEGTPS